MKTQLVLALTLISLTTFSQPVIEWQNTIGGSSGETLKAIHQTADGGYILGGYSSSNISGDKTENQLGGYDYWVVKLDSSGNIQWQNTIGGNNPDILTSLEQTTDGGYILGGYSSSNISGDKTENQLGSGDYWVVKLDTSGNIQWQNVIGGTGDDKLYSIQQTAGGGYIIGGHSDSPVSGDKTEASMGHIDHWVVKLDSSGNIQWQNTIGGNGFDGYTSLKQTTDGGYILGGPSNSDISGDKTGINDSTGTTDYWVIKLNASGNIQWENTIGGADADFLNSIQQTTDGGYILGGWSSSDISRDKTENSLGAQDYWVVKLDNSGNIQWQNTIGGNRYDYLRSIQQTIDGGYILGGFSGSDISGDKTENHIGVPDSVDYWVIKLNASGNIQWQNTIGGSINDDLWSLEQTADGGYILGGESFSSISGDKTENSLGWEDYWVIKLAPDSIIQNLVWPGDANSDGIANVWDVLAIGIGYGISGPARTNATTNWVGQPATDWQLQFLNGVNLKHADCDGNALIDSNDVSVVSLNYGLTHQKGGSPQGRAGADLYLEFPQDSANAGDTVTGSLFLGTLLAPVTNVYGIAFSLTYDQNIVDSNTFRIDFTNSWFTPNNNRISLTKDFYLASKIDAGVSRIDHTDATGAGKIADVSFVIQDNIDGKDFLVLPLDIQFENVLAIDKDEAIVSITSNGDTIYVKDEISSVNQINPLADVRIFPNPAANEIHIVASTKVVGYSITDLAGKRLVTHHNTHSGRITIDVSLLHPGIYFINIKCADNYTFSRKILLLN